jgi:hypothetical protein
MFQYRLEKNREAKLLPVSTTPASKFSTIFPSVVDTGGKQWEQFSNCCQLKMNLKKKMYTYVHSTTQSCPNKIITIFLIEDFFHLSA